MITLKIKKWAPIAGIEHTHTDWQISTTPDDTNIIDEELYSSEYLTIYYSTVTPPVGVAYYIRARRYFSDGSIGNYSDWVAVIGTPDNNRLVINIDVAIDKPLVYVDENIIKDSSIPNFTIETSDFKSNIEGHYSTHWVIYNGMGKVVFKSLYDTTNLTSITIDKSSIGLNNYAYIKIVAIHATATGITSPSGFLYINLANDLFNYEIANRDMDRIYPYSDYTITLNKINQYKVFGVIELALLRAVDGEELFKQTIDPNTGVMRVPGNFIEENSTYLLTLLSLTRDGNYIKNSYMLKSVDINERDIIDKNYTYKLKQEFLYDRGTNILGSFFVTSEWYNGNIPVIESDIVKMLKYDTNTDRLVYADNVNNINIGTNSSNIWMKLLANNNLVIHRVKDTGGCIFDVYEYNPYFNTMQYKHGIEVNDETIALGKTNGITMIGIDEAIYIPVGSNILRKVNFTTKVITNVTTIPMNNLGNATLLNSHDGRVVVIGGADDLTKSYYIKENLWLDHLRNPIEFRNSDLQKIDLQNGDSLIYMTNYSGSNDYLHYDIKNGELNVISDNLVNNTEPDSLIKLKNGRVLRKALDPDTNTDILYIVN